MFIPGIKLGPQDWQERLAASRPQFAEIWYRVDQPDWYPHLFSALRNRGVNFGLHFWGITSTGHEANLAYPGPDQQETIWLMKQCLNTAAAQGADYVNIHSGNTRLLNLNLDDWNLSVDQAYPQITDPASAALRHQALTELGQLAHQLGVSLLVELIPQATYTANNRDLPIPEYPTSPSGLIDLCRQNLIGFTNDFCHTFVYDMAGFDRLTHEFAPYTKLCHINTVYLPYNGTDAHGGILASDFRKPGVFPTKAQLMELLTSIHARSNNNLWLVGEPNHHHLENYQELVQLLTAPPDTDRVGCPN